MAIELETASVGYVPKRLELKNIPKYDNFPYNICYSAFFKIDGKQMMGGVQYFPDFSTFKEDDNQQFMIYFNQYNREWRVEIIYNINKNWWEGRKYFKNESKGQGGGLNWQMFFSHLTMAGAVEGETCDIEEFYKTNI